MSSSTFLKKLKPPGFPDFSVGKGRGALLFFSCFLLLFSCGIIQYSYIYPAENDWQKDNEDTFTFDHDTRNEDTVFEGYILFYRFFSVAQYEQYTQDQDFITYLISLEDADLDNTAIKNPSSYRSKGYRRVYLYPSESVEELTEDDELPYKLGISEELRGDPLSFTIDFVDVVNDHTTVYPELSCDSLETTYSLFRYEESNPSLGTSTLSYLSFSHNDIVQGQKDLPPGIFDQSYGEDSFYLSLFVVPYGSDANFIPYYGEARTLGYISLRFRY